MSEHTITKKCDRSQWKYIYIYIIQAPRYRDFAFFWNYLV